MGDWQHLDLADNLATSIKLPDSFRNNRTLMFDHSQPGLEKSWTPPNSFGVRVLQTKHLLVVACIYQSATLGRALLGRHSFVVFGRPSLKIQW